MMDHGYSFLGGSGGFSGVNNTYAPTPSQHVINPKRKILEFEGLVFRYDYEDKTLTVGPRSSEGGMLESGATTYNEEDLAEFKAALLAFELGSVKPPGDGVTYR